MSKPVLVLTKYPHLRIFHNLQFVRTMMPKFTDSALVKKYFVRQYSRFQRIVIYYQVPSSEIMADIFTSFEDI